MSRYHGETKRSEEPAPGFKFRLAKPEVGEPELDAIRDVFEAGILTNGPYTRKFEEIFAKRHGAPFAVAFSNGTVALSAIFLGLGIGVGDEVIVPSMTFISSATSVLHVGATPIFAEIQPESLNLSPEDVARRISARTKAILAVHYAGQPADMDELLEIAEASGIVVIEDAAEAHGASYRGRSVGSIGRAGMFSFTPTKNITMGEGGLVTTADEALTASLRLLRNHGQADLYHHVSLGYNWRMTEMQAAMGIVQLSKLDAILIRKSKNAEWLGNRLSDVPGVQAPFAAADRTHSFMLYTLQVRRSRDAVLDGLIGRGVEARIYFPPVHRQPIFQSSGEESDLPVTDEVSRRILSIPFHAQLTTQDLEQITTALEESLEDSSGSLPNQDLN